MDGACVVYLLWPPLGTAPLDRFARSYRHHAPGLSHRLVLVCKGPAEAAISRRWREVAGDLHAETMEVPAIGRDLDTYRRVAAEVAARELCFLNTSSEILADDWLAALQRALHEPRAGLVGATGSYESALSAAPRPLRPWLAPRFAPFPNPHIRTNAFMLRRELMLSLRWPAGGGKRRALELESGRNGITRQVWAAGLRALVIDRTGRAHEPSAWPDALTFRSGAQENLLVADNRTRQYADADPARRRELADYAWGPRTPVSSRPRPPAPAA